MNIENDLFEMRDGKYKNFVSSLIPTIDKESVIGVRIPDLRKYAKRMSSLEISEFLSDLPHRYHEENLIHAILISDIKDFSACIKKLDEFLTLVDNWSVCDSLRPVIFAKFRSCLIPEVERWISSDKTYVARFGIEMLMMHFLESDFKEEYLTAVSQTTPGDYYLNMMIAWFFATALAKQWDSTLPYVERGLQNDDIFVKTIRKANESLRISKEQKKILKDLLEKQKNGNKK